ncbi:hypothetical protein HY213_00790 [Candidatus Peregrinibacteria bacterium]|nr:hypothetical protein [Candidatus Peregrinibacteria bacterium]
MDKEHIDQQELFDNEDPFPELTEADKDIAPLMEAIRQRLQYTIRSFKVPNPLPLKKGQILTKKINTLIAKRGLRFKLPRSKSERAATLAYSSIGKQKKKGKRAPIFVLLSIDRRNRTSRLLGTDLATIKLIPVPDHRLRSD